MQKKALIIANFLGFIGFLWNDIEILRSKGFSIDYAGYDADGKEEMKVHDRLVQNEIRYFNIAFDSKNPIASVNIDAFKKINKILRENDYELIHCHTPIVGLLVRFAAIKYRWKGTKVIYTTHGLAFTHLSTFKEKIAFKTLEWAASFLTDAVITINKEDYNAMCKMHAKQVFRINGVGVDFSRYHDVNIDRDKYRKQIGVDKSDIMVLSVGELSSRKNHEIIIKALAQIVNKEKYVYVIAGRGIGASSTESKLLKMAEDLNVRLLLLGFRDDIPQLMHCSDIGAIPSVREGLGLAGIQSLCAGVPLVGSDVQGIKDYIVNNVTGFVCNPFDENDFRDKIQKLSSEIGIRENMKLNCLKMAKLYDVSVSKNQMLHIYNNILSS